MSVKVESGNQFARVATNLATGVVGLLLVRQITQFLLMFHDAGWIIEDMLTVQAGAVIAVDALLLSALVRFEIEIRTFLLLHFAPISSFGNLAASLVNKGPSYFRPPTACPATAKSYKYGLRNWLTNAR